MRALASLVCIVFAVMPGTARAGDDRGGDQRAPEAQSERDRKLTEVDGVPIVGGDSDIGWGGGGVGAITRLTPGARDRWAWRLEGSVFATVRAPPFTVPYQDYWLLLTVPGLYDGRLRLQVRAAFTEESQVRYFGLGNATVQPENNTSPFYSYVRTHPTVESTARLKAAEHAFATLGINVTYDWLSIPVVSKLANDMRSGTPEVRELLGQPCSCAVGLLESSLVWDDRDDELVTRHGTYDELALRIAPPLGTALPYAYEEITAIARAYTTLGKRFTIAVRGVADGLLGSPPFFALTLYQDTYAIGGINAIRGVPAQLYYGKVKVFGTFETRADVARFRAIKKPWGLALVAFVDAGRLWADWSPQPQLDGTGLGLKWGTGLGIRLEEGTAFVVRGDLAWSPDARPIGAYFAAGETF